MGAPMNQKKILDENSRVRRRTASVAGVVVVFVLLIVSSPLWVICFGVYDLLRGRIRFPHVRLLAFAVLWAWAEICGVVASFVLWAFGMRRNVAAHYALQRWWAGVLMKSLRAVCGIRVEVSGADALPNGPLIVLARHASLADSLVSAWVLGNLAGRRPRYVLKRELAFDPCLDIVGHRLPNHFVNREASDPAAEVKELEGLAHDMGDLDVVVIFPEGTRSNAKKRAQRIAELEQRSPVRAERLRGLQHLLPPKPAGALALLNKQPTANVVVCAHTGFDGLDTFGGILRALSRGVGSTRFELRVVPRPQGSDAVEWLDSLWIENDRRVAALTVG